MPDRTSEIAARVKTAFKNKTPLNIQGVGTKSFLGNPASTGEQLDITGHSGILEYDPAELVLVARAGTPLSDIEDALAKQGQILGFEPPFISDGATLGGAVASGLAGPRRAYTGATRDFVLGARFVNGKGEVITSGGKVFKNVAGFDLFRPMSRSMGTLGVILDCALRLLPKPEIERTLLHEENDESNAIEKMNQWAGKIPNISAATWDGHNIRIRLSGSDASIQHGRKMMEGQFLDDETYWRSLNDFELDFFKQPGRLWRICVAPMSGPVHAGKAQLVDWGGSQRWLKSDEPPEAVRARVAALGGHAECYSVDADVETYHPLSPDLLKLQQRFKAALDPAGIFNPGRLYPEL